MEITVVVQRHMDLFVLEPYVKALRRRGARLHFAVAGAVRGECGELIGEGEPALDLDEIARSRRRTGILLNFLRLAFTPRDYSYLYRKWARNTFGSKFRALARIASLLLSGKPNRVNARLGGILRPFLANPFPTERVLNVTKSYVPHLLCASGQRVFTVMGSWDHPGKYPMGHPSEKVFVWNRELGEDWREFQDETEIVISYPVLHDYAIRARNLPADRLIEEPGGRIMYPATTCSWSAEDIHREELRLIEALCRATRDSGRTLFLKPKPNSRPGELDHFSERHAHVEVGHYQGDGSTSTFRLSDDYNRKRLEELGRCGLVVNLGTTFATDAAAYGLPVVQLLLDRPDDFPVLSRLSRYPHLARHYFRRAELVYDIGPEGELEEGLAFLGGKEPREMKRARAFSLHLRRWIIRDEEMETAAGRVAEACLQ